MSAFEPGRPSAAQKRPWMVTFVDLATQLVAFFVLMFSMSNVEPAKYQALVEAYGEAFGRPVDKEPAPKIDLPDIKLLPGDNLGYLASVLSATFSQSRTLSDVEFQLTSQYLKLSLPERSLFIPGAGEFQAEARDTIFDLGGVLSNLNNRIAVVGSAAMSQPGAQDREKWSLAMRRAQAMADALAMAGYDQDITVLGQGGSPTDVAAALGLIDVYIMPERPGT